MFNGDQQLFEKVEGTYKEIQIELIELQEDKLLMQAEDRITQEVRRRILEIKGQNEQDESDIVKR